MLGEIDRSSDVYRTASLLSYGEVNDVSDESAGSKSATSRVVTV